MKKLFGLLTFILIGLINFGYCDTVESLLSTTNFSVNNVSASFKTLFTFDYEYGTTVCMRLYSESSTASFYIGFTSTDNGTPSQTYIYTVGMRGGYFCLFGNTYSVAKVSSSITTNVRGDYFVLNDFLKTDLPILTSQECQSEYDLMPISDYTSANCMVDFNLLPVSVVNQNYCVSNGLCPSSSGTGDCDYGSGDNWSALFINNIQHLGKPIINVTIPDYIFWDYETNEDVFNLYVGSGYDQDYIDSVISINSYRPDTSDFTDIFVSGLTLIMPYIVILLFIVFIRKFIKRIFK